MTAQDIQQWFYTQPGPMTALPDPLSWFHDLPTDPGLLRQVLHGVLIHGDLVHLYGLGHDDVRMREIHLRPVGELLAALRSRADLPLAVARQPEDRVWGSCRHFAVLYCALLRDQGVPSRVRCGFANYFDPASWVDHWILEYWNTGTQRWQRADAELDPVVTKVFRVALDPEDLPATAFLAGAEAWRGYRRGELDPELFGFGDSRGAKMIAGSVIRDLAALNKDEMLPWDYWGVVDDWDLGRSTVDESVIDGLADAVLADAQPELERAYRRDGIAVPADLDLVRPDR
ncbi:transglutaminase-like domain-containing protein [Actinocrispum wychmicini]|uniref:Transglutaminase superfamily protein n=1 Tax=Actinocrispum wychmicini TaxID=1213861 RepID=A0A4R2JQZ6_9PSEU|nr:transglutaminase-like domain-containing protein [Actinocrispum wychmicini]TCO61894.1 transglutaminase superfamily protein [Actinocrispum wychmicini]